MTEPDGSTSKSRQTSRVDGDPTDAYAVDDLRRWVQGLSLARLLVDHRPRKMDGFCITVSNTPAGSIDLDVLSSLLGITSLADGWNPLAEINGEGHWAMLVSGGDHVSIFVPGVTVGDDRSAPFPANQVDEAAFRTAVALERALFPARLRCVEPEAGDDESVISPATRPEYWADGELIVHRAIVSGLFVAIPKAYSLCRSSSGFWMLRTGRAIDETNAKFFGTGIGEQRLNAALLNRRRHALDRAIGAVEQRLVTESDFRRGDHVDWADVVEVTERIVTDAADRPYALVKVRTRRRRSTTLRFVGHDPSVPRAFFQPVADRYAERSR